MVDNFGLRPVEALHQARLPAAATSGRARGPLLRSPTEKRARSRANALFEIRSLSGGTGLSALLCVANRSSCLNALSAAHRTGLPFRVSPLSSRHCNCLCRRRCSGCCRTSSWCRRCRRRSKRQRADGRDKRRVRGRSDGFGGCRGERGGRDGWRTLNEVDGRLARLRVLR